MNTLLTLTSVQLKRAAAIKEEIGTLEVELEALLGISTSIPAKPVKKRKMSASARKKIADAQKARWAKFHAKKGK